MSKSKYLVRALVPILGFAVLATGCATRSAKTDMTDLERSVEEKSSAITDLESSVSDLERRLAAESKQAD